MSLKLLTCFCVTSIDKSVYTIATLLSLCVMHVPRLYNVHIDNTCICIKKNILSVYISLTCNENLTRTLCIHVFMFTRYIPMYQ